MGSFPAGLKIDVIVLTPPLRFKSQTLRPIAVTRNSAYVTTCMTQNCAPIHTLSLS